VGTRADFLGDADTGREFDASSTTEVGSADSAAIAEDIEQTRNEMDQTIGAIQDRLDPERLTEQAVDAATEVTVQARDAAKDVAKFAIDEAKSAVRDLADQARGAVRDSTVGRVEHIAASTRNTAMEVQDDMFTVIRQNPIPAALAAIGIGWLWMSRSESSHEPTRGYGYAPYGYESGWQRGQTDRSRGQGQTMTGQAEQMASQVMGQAQGMAGQAQQMAEQTVGQAQHMAEQKFSEAQDAAGRMQYQAKSTVQDMAADPVALGALGLAFGAVAGLLLPETEPEAKIFGEARAQVTDRVQGVAGQAVDTVQRVAADVAETAINETRGAMEQASSSAGGVGA
jgi:hypothetical protein